MKFSKLSQLILVSSISLLVATFFSACALVTVDYVYVACSSGSGASSAGEIETYAVDSASGALRTGAATVSSGGVNPVSMAVTSDYSNLYVAHQGSPTSSGSIVHFTIATDGTLTADPHTVTLNTPIALAVNSAGTYLYVVSCTAAANTAYPTLSCTGGATLTEYSLNSGAIGSTAVSTQALSLYGTYAAYSGDVLVPTGLNVLANNAAVYVTAYDQSSYYPGGTPTCTSNCANPGWVFGYTIGSDGTLNPLANPLQAGVKPTAIASDPTNRFVYVTDYENNNLIGYAIMSTNTLNFLPNDPFITGGEPSAVTIDPRGKFIYVSNSLDNTVSAYEITLATGIPTASFSATSGAGYNSTDTRPVAVTVEPALGRFAYTANYLNGTVSGFRLDPTSGSVSQTQATPYPTGFHPTALVSVPNGNHATQSVNP
jgi:6-phosphogluconolactonase (cycloisomerase 2 family)